MSRPRDSIADLKARGTYRKDRHANRDEPCREPAAWSRKLPSSSKSARVRRYIDLIPGYDPHRGAGDCTFSTKRARHAIDWIHTHCIHVKGSLTGQALELTPLQMGIIGNLFGWVRPDGTRRYRKCLIYVARKWGKTLIAAAIALYCLFESRGSGDDWEYVEGGVEAYCAAAARDQAKLLWSAAKRMIQSDRLLSERCRIYQHSVARIGPDGEQDSSYFQAISGEANTAHGFNPQVYTLDELHAQPDGELLDVLDTGTASRTQPLAVLITTADFDRESICNEEHDYAAKVRDGEIDDPYYLPVIYEANTDDDWADEATWVKANPNYPVTPTRDYMEARARKAAGNPRFLNTFKRLNLNMRTASELQWLDMVQWDACSASLTRDEWEAEAAALAGHRCFGGLDMGSTNDLTAFALVFPDDDWAVFPLMWVPDAAARRRDERHEIPSYSAWSREGWLRITEGNMVDHETVAREIVSFCSPYEVAGIAVDRYHAEWIEQRLGREGLPVKRFGQGYVSMSGPAKHMEILVGRADLDHFGHPVLRWNAANAMAVGDDAGNIKPTKSTGRGKQKRVSDNKIDGLVATIMGIGMAIADDHEESPFMTRGVLVV